MKIKKIYSQEKTATSASGIYVPVDDGSRKLKGMPIEDVGGGDKTFIASPINHSIVTLTSGTLIVGKAYTIKTYQSGDDFANVADIKYGTINAVGCCFVATDTTPTSWANGTSIVENDIIENIYKNTIGYDIDMFLTCNLKTPQQFFLILKSDAKFQGKIISIIDFEDNSTSTPIGFDVLEIKDYN